MEVDVVLVFVLVGGFLLGYFRGAVRQLIVLGAWLVAFVLAPYLRPPVGDFIVANTHEYSREYVDMLAFLASFAVLFVLALLVIEIGGHTVELSQRRGVDELLGGFLMLGATLLSIAAIVIALDSYYVSPVAGAAEVSFVQSLHAALDKSAIVDAMHDALIPGLITILGPLLPSDIRSLYVAPAS